MALKSALSSREELVSKRCEDEDVHQVFKPNRLLYFSFCCCDKQQKEKQLRKERVDLILQSQVTVHLQSVRQELKVGIGGWNHGGMFYSDFLLAHVQLPFSYSLAHVPRDGTAYSGLATSISNPDDASRHAHGPI